LLLLGAGESGKSTIFKQIKILYGNGMDENYRVKARPQVWSNILEACNIVIEACDTLGHKLEGEDALKAAERVTEQFAKMPGSEAKLSEEVVDSILLLKKNPQIQACLEERSKFQLIDSWDYLSEKLEKYPAWGGPSWIPTEEDVLNTRVRTTGVIMQNVTIDNSKYQIIDVGGQRTERRKWMRLFQGVTGILFVASLSEYDQTLYEDSETNRLDETLNLWKTNANRKEFEDSTMILVLNKFDLFIKKYFHKKVPIEYDGEYVHSPEGVGPPLCSDEANEKCEKAIEWYANMFKAQVPAEKRSSIYVHVTTALNPQNMEAFTSSCAKHVLRQGLMKAGLT